MPKLKDNEIVKDGDPLVGRFFHTFKGQKDGGELLCGQGHVIGKIQEGYYLVQYYSWVIGEATHQGIHKLDEMVEWVFYEDSDAMRFSYEYGIASRFRLDRETSAVRGDLVRDARALLAKAEADAEAEARGI
jgi:hypothetical protein